MFLFGGGVGKQFSKKIHCPSFSLRVCRKSIILAAAHWNGLGLVVAQVVCGFFFIVEWDIHWLDNYTSSCHYCPRNTAGRRDAKGVVFRKLLSRIMSSWLFITFSSKRFSIFGFMRVFLIDLDLSFVQGNNMNLVTFLNTQTSSLTSTIC